MSLSQKHVERHHRNNIPILEKRSEIDFHHFPIRKPNHENKIESILRIERNTRDDTFRPNSNSKISKKKNRRLEQK